MGPRQYNTVNSFIKAFNQQKCLIPGILYVFLFQMHDPELLDLKYSMK